MIDVKDMEKHREQHLNTYVKHLRATCTTLIISLLALASLLMATAAMATPLVQPGLHKISLGGVEQTLQIYSNDVSKPLLLVLHGGPGYAMLPLLHETNSALEDDFTVVNWDQRGAGRSYSAAIPLDSMTLAQLVADAHELTGYLKTAFGQQKIFILGHSFGTLIGMQLIQSYPQDYRALASVGQVVNVIENEQLSYDFALSQAAANHNLLAITELNDVGRPDDDGEYADEAGYDVTAAWMGHYGGDLYGETSTDEIEQALLDSDIYANYQAELVNGWDFSQHLFDDPYVWELDLRSDIPQVSVPVYFFTGRHDYDTPWALVVEYYNQLVAPAKGLIWFENSAHFPFYEEPVPFNNALISAFSSH